MKDLQVHYMGGEPMLGWKEILKLNKEMKAFCEENGIKFGWSMTSNLVALNEEKKELMIKENAGIHCSVDGPKFIQDMNRPFLNGDGSFEIVDKNISLALQISPQDTARVTITPLSSHHIPEIVEYLFSKGFERVGLFPSYNLDWEENDLRAWEEGIRKACEISFEKKKQISTVIHPRRREKIEFDYCGAGKGLWALDVEGVLYNCHRLTNKREYAIINASDSSVEEIREAMIEKSLAPCNIEVPEKCKECPALKFCSGGCWAENLYINKDQYFPEGVACAFRQITHRAIKEYLDMPNIDIKAWQCIAFVICCMVACDGCEVGCHTCDGCYHCESCEASWDKCMSPCDPHD